MASMITTTPPRPTNQYNLVEVYRLLEILAASIIRATHHPDDRDRKHL
jgi:hypothetical protein